MRNMSLTIGYTRAKTLRLSDLSTLFNGRSGVTLRRASYLSSHLRDPERLERSSPMGFFPSEPRASSPPHDCMLRPCTAVTGMVGYVRVYPGWYRVYIWGIPRVVHRVVHY